MGTDAGQNNREGAPPSSARGTHDSTPYPDMVASVIQHQVRAGAEAQYEAWLRKITPVAEGFPGHRGVEWTRPPEGTHTYTVTLRFDTQEHAQGWLRSDVRRQLIAEVEPLLERGEKVAIKTGLEFWFTPPAGQKHAKPYKQFLITLSVVFPLTLVVPWALRPLFQVAPVVGLPVISNFVIAAIIVGLMTYVIMPHYTRLVAAWLYD
jgi:uncharacterized protein